ncbi:helix-turn-helix transcriptional regulator [Methylibium petroleiphilum]|uniref:helix-turn-helix transcriptional regulator n=1 Tax=Methylibium petroleiphilum TaxID=105560 RepID=UPI002354DE9B|nr:AlpA family phage regulatory protein [Methylibium petroleiphilum]
MPMRTTLPGGAAAATLSHATESGAATNPSPCLPDTGFLRQRQVLAFVPISKSTLWRQVRARSFPSPVKLSAGVTAWRAEDVRRWITEQGGS